MSYAENLSVNFQKDGTSDVFGRLKISNSENIFDSKLIYDKRDLYYTESLTSGATSNFITNNACVDLEVTTTIGSRAIRQTREYFNYQSGKGMFTSISFVLGNRKSGIVRRVGIFDANNGFFLEQTSTELRIVRRTRVTGSVVNHVISQSSWNIDKLDGTGKSGFTLDESKIQLMSIEYTWQGAGQCRFGFYCDNTFIICHEERFSNYIDTVSISNPCLPIRFEIEVIGVVVGNSTFRTICISVNKEGKYDLKGITYSALNLTAVTVNNNTDTAIFAIRLKSSFNRIPVKPRNLGILTPGNSPLIFFVYVGNITITGGTWNSAGVYSAIESNTSMTGFTLNQAELMASGYSSSQSRIQSQLLYPSLKLTSDFAGNSSILLVVGRGIGKTSAMASLEWIEEW